MGLGQAGGDLAHERQGLGRSQRSLPNSVLERLPFHELHGDIGVVAALPDLVDDTYVRMGQGRGRLGLDQEPLPELGQAHQVGRKELQGHEPFEFDVLGPIDDAHPALADLLDDPVLAGDEAARVHDPHGRLQGLRQGHPLRPSPPSGAAQLPQNREASLFSE